MDVQARCSALQLQARAPRDTWVPAVTSVEHDLQALSRRGSCWRTVPLEASGPRWCKAWSSGISARPVPPLALLTGRRSCA